MAADCCRTCCDHRRRLRRGVLVAAGVSHPPGGTDVTGGGFLSSLATTFDHAPHARQKHDIRTVLTQSDFQTNSWWQFELRCIKFQVTSLPYYPYTDAMALLQPKLLQYCRIVPSPQHRCTT